MHVLAVGVRRYQVEQLGLKWADKDAVDFARNVLANGQASGYHAIRLYSLTNEDASREGVIGKFLEVLDAMQEGDIAMVLFSGHGISQGAQYYLLPYDTRVSSRADMIASAVPYAWMREELRGLAAKGPTLLFLDACRSGTAANGGEVLDVDAIASDLRRRDERGPNRGVIVFASSTGSQLSLEDDSWENGAFTKALLEGFDGGADEWGNLDDQTSVEEIFEFVDQRVQQLTNKRQEPQLVLPDDRDADMVLFMN